MLLFEAFEVLKAGEGNEGLFLRNLVQHMVNLLECFVFFKIDHILRNLNWAEYDVVKFRLRILNDLIVFHIG